MANEPINTPVQTEYEARLAAALEANQAEQATIAARLDKLRAEEKWITAALADTPSAVSAVPVPADAVAAVVEDTAAVPLPRAENTVPAPAPTAKRAARKGAARKAAAASVKTATGKKAAPKKTPATTKQGAAAEPTLGELLVALLSKQPGEPKKAGEIQSEMELAHPGRATSAQTVRNALEKLTVTSGLEKSKQQNTVFYTWPAAAPAPEDEAKAEEAAPAGV
ncbi:MULTISPECIES: hypothetical protein [unclassified Streptomyces]|uniref:hypothetical protein n=1 Tax=unclassified Streptomyces TaxID=2593676 RepID=UPI0036F8488F